MAAWVDGGGVNGEGADCREDRCVNIEAIGFKIGHELFVRGEWMWLMVWFLARSSCVRPFLDALYLVWYIAVV
jgi:hypothetical protein